MRPELVKTWLQALQARIVAQLEAVDGQAFRRDGWERPTGGGGLSCVIEEGGVFERGGVNFSHVTGPALPPNHHTGSWPSAVATK